MATHYLCSRSELFREMYIESDDSLLLISPPEDFTEWFRRAIPSRYAVADDLDSIPEGEVFDHIIFWTDSLKKMQGESVRRLCLSFSGKRNIWLGIRAGDLTIEEGSTAEFLDLELKGPVIYLSTDHDLFRVVDRQTK